MESEKSQHQERIEGRGNVFKPACPHCGSKDCIIDDRVRSNAWREMLVYWMMFVGAMTVTLFMRCRSCDRSFKSWKSQAVEDQDKASASL